jgi:hypothetical protein
MLYIKTSLIYSKTTPPRTQQGKWNWSPIFDFQIPEIWLYHLEAAWCALETKFNTTTSIQSSAYLRISLQEDQFTLA